MNKRIGEVAGKIWEILGEKGSIDIARLPRLTKEKSAMAYQAVGWLARENKIQYETKNAKTYIELTPSELASYEQQFAAAV